MNTRRRTLAFILTIAIGPAGARQARAQEGAAGPPHIDEANVSAPQQPPLRPSLLKPFTDLAGDMKRLPSVSNLDWLVVGMAAALGAHSADIRVDRTWSLESSPTFKPGAIVGATPIELGAAFTTYVVGRSTDSPRAMRLGSDLIRAQLMAEIMTVGVKQTVRRSRPSGSGFSFPSGHTAVTFASATVFQRHFGWKVGVPAYAVASYVAASRVRTRRHFLSDVAFGAAVGIVAGRTVTLGGSRRVALAPMATDGGGGIAFTWVGRK